MQQGMTVLRFDTLLRNYVTPDTISHSSVELFETRRLTPLLVSFVSPLYRSNGFRTRDHGLGFFFVRSWRQAFDSPM
jgi:hypothetical protein